MSRCRFPYCREPAIKAENWLCSQHDRWYWDWHWYVARVDPPRGPLARWMDAAREVERRLKARLEARQDSLRAMGRTDINGLSAAWEMVEEIVEELEGKALADWQAEQQAHPHNWYCKCGTFLPREFYERVLDIWEERTGVNGKPRVVTPADWKWSLEQALAELEGDANYD